MMTPASSREATPEEALAAALAREETQGRRIEQLEAENRLLREKIDLLVRKIFGKSSEALDDKQLMLLLQGGDPAKKDQASQGGVCALEAEIKNNDKPAGTAKQPRKERGVRVPAHLPVSEEIVLEPEEVKAAPAAYRHVNDEVTEQLDYTPGRYTRRLIIRPKYVKRDEPYKAPVIAELPALMERCKAAPGLLAHIIVSKYCDHLPLYRQEQIARLRHGIELPRQTTARWVAWAARSLVPIYEHIHTGIMSGGYVQADETMIEYLEPGHGQTKQGYFWTLKRPGGDAVFVWKPSRSGQSLASIIPADFTGTLGCDGYSVYQTFAASSDGRVSLAACWAHVRRKFDEAKESAPLQALNVLKQIQNLYLIEKRLRKTKAGPRLRAAVRDAESRPIIERIGKLLRLWQMKRHHLPQSLMGKAIAYTLTLWPMLQTYLEDGRAEIDNNLVENAIRPTAVGKKNWLFIGNEAVGECGAILFTIIEACRSRGLDPWAYLRDVLTRLPTMTNKQVGQVTPEAWAKDQRTRQRLAA
jgi:transposase